MIIKCSSSQNSYCALDNKPNVAAKSHRENMPSFIISNLLFTFVVMERFTFKAGTNALVLNVDMQYDLHLKFNDYTSGMITVLCS